VYIRTAYLKTLAFLLAPYRGRRPVRWVLAKVFDSATQQPGGASGSIILGVQTHVEFVFWFSGSLSACRSAPHQKGATAEFKAGDVLAGGGGSADGIRTHVQVAAFKKLCFVFRANSYLFQQLPVFKTRLLT
jgi:hypothetical protein